MCRFLMQSINAKKEQEPQNSQKIHNRKRKELKNSQKFTAIYLKSIFFTMVANALASFYVD